MAVTENLALYTEKRGINLAAMSRATGISYSTLYASLRDKNRKRALSVDEAVLVCKFLGEKVEDFADAPESGKKVV